MPLSFPLDLGPVRPSDGGNCIHGWGISSRFGPRNGGFHGGIDLAFQGCTGMAIRTVAPCLVNQAWDSGGGGNWTMLFLDDGSAWGIGHASIFDDPDGPGPAKNWNGRRAPQGTVVAYVGTTGGSSGPHAHVAYRPPGAGSYVNPETILRQMPLWVPAQPDPDPIPHPPKVARMIYVKFPNDPKFYERVKGTDGKVWFCYEGNGGAVALGQTIPLASGVDWIDGEWDDASKHGRVVGP